MSASKKAAKKPAAKTTSAKNKAKPAAGTKPATAGAVKKTVTKVHKPAPAKAASKPKAAAAGKKAPGKQAAPAKKGLPAKKATAAGKPAAKAPAKGAATQAGKAAALKSGKDTAQNVASTKGGDKKAATAKSKPTASKSLKTTKPAANKATTKPQPQSAGKKTAPSRKPQPEATTAARAPAPKPASPRPTAHTEAAKTGPAAKKARHTFVKQSSSSKQDNSQPAPELDPKTKELVLGARKRTANGSAPKPGRSGKGAIAFTMDDVVQVLAKRQHEPDAKATVEKAVTKVAKKQEVQIDIPQEKRVHSAVSLSDILGFNPTDKKGAPATSKGREVPRKWSRYHKLLTELREQVSNVLAQHTAETLKRSNRDDSGDLSGYGQHMADAGTDTFDRDFALSMVSSEQEALFEINEAIERIYNGTYGACEITGEPISAERLEAVPFTRYSLEGQKELEKTKRQKIQRGGVFTDNEDNIPFDEDDN